MNCAGVDHTPNDGSGEGNTGTEMQVTLMSDEGWQRMLDIHLNGAFFCTRAMVKRLVDAGEGGSIICISSIAGHVGMGAGALRDREGRPARLRARDGPLLRIARHPRQRDRARRDLCRDDEGRGAGAARAPADDDATGSVR